MKIYIKVIIGIVALFVFLVIVSAVVLLPISPQQNTISTPSPSPTPTPTPTPIQSSDIITLSSNAQVVSLNTYDPYLTNVVFTLTITQNGSTPLKFPCAITVSSSNFPYMTGGMRNFENYGTYVFSQYELHMFDIPLTPNTVTYYVVVWDSNHTRTESNKLTIQFK